MQGILAPVFLSKEELDAALEISYQSFAVRSAAYFQEQLKAASQELATATAAVRTTRACWLLVSACHAACAHQPCRSWRLQVSGQGAGLVG